MSITEKIVEVIGPAVLLAIPPGQKRAEARSLAKADANRYDS